MANIDPVDSSPINAAQAAAQSGLIGVSGSGAGVRRVHTISSSTSRSRSRIVEERDGWEDGLGEEDYIAYDGIGPEVDQGWDDGLGSVWAGEGLQRHNSMPSRYSRAFSSRYNQASPPPSSTTVPQSGSKLRMRNSLQQIQAEADEQAAEEDWEREMRGLRSAVVDPSSAPGLSPTDPLVTPTSAQSHHQHTHSRSHSQSSTTSPISPFLPSLYPSAPHQPYEELLSSDMRRHQSLTYGQRRISDRLARSPALRHPSGRGHGQTSSIGSVGSVGSVGSGRSNSPRDHTTSTGEPELSPPTSPIRASPWATPPPPPPAPSSRTSSEEPAAQDPNQSWESRIEQVQRAIAQFALEGAAHMKHTAPPPPGSGSTSPGFTAPRFAAQQQTAPKPATPQPPPSTTSTPSPAPQWPANRPQLNLVTSPPPPTPKGPISAAPAFPVTGGPHTNPYLPVQYSHTPLNIAPGPPGAGGLMPPPPPLPAGYSGKHVHRGSSSSVGTATSTNTDDSLSLGRSEGSAAPTPTQTNYTGFAPGVGLGIGPGVGQGLPNQGVFGQVQQFLQQQALAQQQQGGGGAVANLQSPVDVPALIAAKGYNPTAFDTQPLHARYFVIKSYTEDDVHKSLKYEIWSSTEPGNKRLDRAFKENAGRGAIYLFFSVNASGHFCGVAEMLTPLDYTRSSTVWTQDKWKGVFKVRWIFVRDVPNSVLRHIRLTNTQEKKPVTNSRDTQELLPDAGHEMLRIFLTHPARTSLLQDFVYYENKNNGIPNPTTPQPQGTPQFQQGGTPQFQQGGTPQFQQGGTPQFQQGTPQFQQGGTPQFQQGGIPQFQQGPSPQFQQGPTPQFQPQQQSPLPPPFPPYAMAAQHGTPPPMVQQFATMGTYSLSPQPPFALPAHARSPSPGYEQTLQEILRRTEGSPIPPPHQGAGIGGGIASQLPTGATVTQFVPSPAIMGGSNGRGF